VTSHHWINPLSLSVSLLDVFSYVFIESFFQDMLHFLSICQHAYRKKHLYVKYAYLWLHSVLYSLAIMQLGKLGCTVGKRRLQNSVPNDYSFMPVILVIIVTTLFFNTYNFPHSFKVQGCMFHTHS